MGSSNHSPKIVNTSCPYVVDYCGGLVLRPPPGTRFEVVCSVDDFRAESEEAFMTTVSKTAQRCGFRPKTLYNWIETGKLREQHGLRRWGKRWRIEWRIFKASFDRGEFASCS